MTTSTDHQVYPGMPLTPEGPLESAQPEVQAHSVETIQADYDQIRTALHEEASRLAVSGMVETSTPFYDETIQEVNPELMPIPEAIRALKEVTGRIESTQQKAVIDLMSPLMKQYPRTILERMGLLEPSRPNPHKAGGESMQMQLAREDGRVAARLLLNVPKEEVWTLYPSHGEWFIERAMRETTTIQGETVFLDKAHPWYSSVHYEQHPKAPWAMIKSEMIPGQEGLQYDIVSAKELQDLLTWAQRFETQVASRPDSMPRRRMPMHRQDN